MRKISRLAMEEIRSDRLVYALIGLYLVLASAMLVPVGHIFADLYVEYLFSLLVLDVVALPALVLIGLSLRSIAANPRHPAAWLRACLDQRRIARILAGFVLLLALAPFMATFTAMKSFIGLDGFTSDASLADIDRWLHFGTDPAILLHGLINYPHTWRIFAFFYGPGWMLWVNGFVFWMAVAASKPNIRRRFFVSYIFAWVVLGNLVAWLAMSAGPAFFAQVTGDTDRFASTLAAVSANTLPNGSGIRDVQLYLWDLYVTRTSGFGMGISAFPSLHVAMVTLCALVALEVDRLLAIAGLLIVLLIEAGSILFGWHYAIDGYFSIVVMAVLWRALRQVPALGLDGRDVTEATIEMAGSSLHASAPGKVV
ncbi:phosphatase PAP2 family protein [Pleomorphomonas sp. JP5]|uniref:phosphatase PAP2 family protein n=1 Tax=Pleomorphomonas sp. JP5 TaxID=2942998 RepID=UPI0020448AD5|nr:phosphatase PAP2 family protein [Pleomorphomonas sp. JP5]MCM5557989.1 phosphatase PAP2 family protein [Pleomorphomonas sp. JP5]